MMGSARPPAELIERESVVLSAVGPKAGRVKSGSKPCFSARQALQPAMGRPVGLLRQRCKIDDAKGLG